MKRLVKLGVVGAIVLAGLLLLKAGFTGMSEEGRSARLAALDREQALLAADMLEAWAVDATVLAGGDERSNAVTLRMLGIKKNAVLGSVSEGGEVAATIECVREGAVSRHSADLMLGLIAMEMDRPRSGREMSVWSDYSSDSIDAIRAQRGMISGNATKEDLDEYTRLLKDCIGCNLHAIEVSRRARSEGRLARAEADTAIGLEKYWREEAWQRRMELARVYRYRLTKIY